MTRRYFGEFFDTYGHLWGVEILQRDWTGEVGELTFPGSGVLEIQWEETDKIAPVQSSTATLTIESPGDRTYIDLYTITPGDIMLNVTRDGKQYWRGALDPEFYEEPYERADSYDVSLTFSDFGILDRLKWSTQGIPTLDTIIKNLLFRAGLGNSYSLMCSTLLEDTPLTLERIAIHSQNFYDEDNEPMTLREVLEAILQPLSLRIIQRSGNIIIYDLNALAQADTTGIISWSGDRQTLGTDIVVNNARVTFSPYERFESNDSFSADDIVEDKNITIFVDPGRGGAASGTLRPREYGFFLIIGDKGKTKTPFVQEIGHPFAIRSVYSGSDAAGAMVYYKDGINVVSGIYGEVVNAYPNGVKNDCVGEEAVVSAPIYLVNPQRDDSLRGNNPAIRLKIALEVLIDVRYNPFEDASSNNNIDEWNKFRKNCRYGYLLGSLLFKDADGSIISHYNNRNLLTGDNETEGWIAGPPARPDTFIFAYYDKDEPGEKCCWGVWTTNAPGKKFDGELISAPNGEGYIEMRILNGIYAKSKEGNAADVAKLVKWVLLRTPSIEVVDPYGNKIESRDFEYTAEINHEARDSMEITTTCGSGMIPVKMSRGTFYPSKPCARGIYLGTNHNQLNLFTRAGVTDVCEKLLIGTIFSNYSTRHTKLTGECEIIEGAVPVLAEVNQPEGTRFIIAGEVQRCDEGVAETTFVEVLKDDFEGIEYE